MKRIAIIGTVASSLYTFRGDLIKKLVAKNYLVFAFTSEYTLLDLEKVKSLGAIPVVYQLNRGGLNPFSDIIATYQLIREIKQIHPDVVFSYFAKPVIFASLAAKFAKVPIIIAMLEGLGYSFTEQPEKIRKKIKIIKFIQVLLYRLVLPQVDKLIFLNPDDFCDLLIRHNISVRKVEILGGIGVDLESYPYIPVERNIKNVRFLFIGRLLKEKGIHEFLSAIKIVKEIYPETVFIVLGAIDHANMGALTQQELDHYVQSGLIQYPGYVSDVKSWIIYSHVFVLPSYREGVPRSTQEAMAIGRPIITTNVPGCRETVRNGINGFLIPKWNPEILAEKMIYFIENREKICSMGWESHKMAKKKFDSCKINEKLMKIMGI